MRDGDAMGLNVKKTGLRNGALVSSAIAACANRRADPHGDDLDVANMEEQGDEDVGHGVICHKVAKDEVCHVRR